MTSQFLFLPFEVFLLGLLVTLAQSLPGIKIKKTAKAGHFQVPGSVLVIETANTPDSGDLRKGPSQTPDGDLNPRGVWTY